MRKRSVHILTLLFIVLSQPLWAQKDIPVQSRKPFNIGETIEFSSEVLGENRQLNIYLPQSYAENTTQPYPVIYLLDGSTEEDFIHIAGLVQFGSFSWIEMIPESIVVGIVNVDRRRDFTYPTLNKKDKKDFPTTGKSADFIDFIDKELQPLVEKQYRVTATKTLIGQSLGGLLATEILFKRPQLFDNYIIVSPSLWWDNQSLLKATPVSYPSQKSVFIAVGKEGAVMERTAKALYEKLKADNKANTDLYFEFFEKRDHGDALHLAVYSAFEKIFAKTDK
ncbi:MAG: alpha/beta hydrolase [Roseivirga sp.]|nr:alpha/beta hydrolase [Roseivirga sp.]